MAPRQSDVNGGSIGHRNGYGYRASVLENGRIDDTGSGGTSLSPFPMLPQLLQHVKSTCLKLAAHVMFRLMGECLADA